MVAGSLIVIPWLGRRLLLEPCALIGNTGAHTCWLSPLLRYSLSGDVRIRDDLRAWFRTAGILSPFALPWDQRFHIGFPAIRGVAQLCRDDGNVPSGADYFAIGGIKNCIPIKGSFTLDLFLNGGVTMLTEKRQKTWIVACGAGMTWTLGKSIFELATIYPMISTPGLHTPRVQFRIDQEDVI
jgi:hypothetical protein